ncbi:MAG: hypothetical protein CEN87_409 [Parcubacteria group bacterium Licking1014_1]|nr:MAG: hypothetical protein CEN87_409 [Parcubacteria group bacterium Licking1014_1]
MDPHKKPLTDVVRRNRNVYNIPDDIPDQPQESLTSFILHSMQRLTILVPSDAGQKLCFP